LLVALLVLATSAGSGCLPLHIRSTLADIQQDLRHLESQVQAGEWEAALDGHTRIGREWRRVKWLMMLHSDLGHIRDFERLLARLRPLLEMQDGVGARTEVAELRSTWDQLNRF
jgi:hypothetical protein